MRTRVCPSLLVAVVSLLLTGCGSSSSGGSGFTGGDGGNRGGDSGGTLGGGDGGTHLLGDGGTGGGDSAGNSNCSQATQYVYTLAGDNSLYQFDPPSLTFTLIGVLNCPSGGASPYSMAVDRNANAWVVFTDGKLYKVNTQNAACAATSFQAGQHGWTTFGMGFSTDTAGGTSETLYVSESSLFNGGATMGLGRIDTTTLQLVPIGMYDLITARAELTGTGDARLFGAFEGMPYVVAQIDKTAAHILSQAPQTAINYAPDTSNFAFAFWGGDFWLFVGPGTSTDVFHYQPSVPATTKVKTVSFEIVGAGVSTCAPVVPPK